MKEEKLNKYIEAAKKLHNNKFTYEHIGNPNTTKDPIFVTCPIHGDFKTTLDNHARAGTGCPSCGGVKRHTTEEVVDRLKEVFSDKNYTYENVDYKNSKTKIKITCHNKDIFGNEHGVFEAVVKHLFNGHGCPKCANRYITTEEAIAKAKKVHGDKYDYSLVEYKGKNSDRLPIICHEKDEDGVEHGVFTPIWYSHLEGVGCPKCNGGVKWDKDKFVLEAKKKHGNYYSYDKFEYVNAKTKGIITCPRHGDFMQTPYLHATLGRGCPKCKSSRLESLVISKLNKAKIDYEYQVYVEGLGKQTLDFKIPSKKVFIECQGEQHYIPTDFGKLSEQATNEVFEARLRSDEEKYNVCKSLGYEVIYFTDPSTFHKKGVDVYDGFYSDKKVFLDATEIVKFLSGIDNEDCGTVLCNFVSNVKSLGLPIVVNNRRIKYGDVVIFLNSLTDKESINISERHRAYCRRGMRPIDIFEDEYSNHPDIVISKIKHILGIEGNCEKINARKCTVSEISKEESEKFLESNHIQGFVNSTVYLGCFDNDRLVGVMQFLREDGDGKWNLTRFATLNGTICRGVGGKLFKHFVKQWNPNEIKSFADKRWTANVDNNLYTKLGFEYVKSGKGKEYRYWKDGETSERLHKFGFRKQILHKKYGLPLSMTELEMTKQLGYTRIWDCGLFKYVWRRNDKG